MREKRNLSGIMVLGYLRFLLETSARAPGPLRGGEWGGGSEQAGPEDTIPMGSRALAANPLPQPSFSWALQPSNILVPIEGWELG